MEEKINFMFRQIKQINKEEPPNEELSSHLLNYTCVLLSGYIEIEVNRIIKNYDNSDNECKGRVNTIQNATWCKIKAVLSLIDINLTIELHRAIAETNNITSIYAVIQTRNKIVHGDDITSLELQTLEIYFKEIKNFIDEAKRIFSLGN